MRLLLACDTGTAETGVALIDIDTYKPLLFGKIANEQVFLAVERYLVEKNLKNKVEIYFAFEEFKSYGMPIGDSTIKSITWNGRFIESYIRDYRGTLSKAVEDKNCILPIMRVEEKINLCQTTKAKDTNIRQALIDRFGVVGTKKNQGFFYGFKKDIWSAFAVGVTAIDKHFYNFKVIR